MNQLFGAVDGFGIKEQGITGTKVKGAVSVGVHHFALQHVDEFGSGMFKKRGDLRFLGEGEQVGFKQGIFSQAVP